MPRVDSINWESVYDIYGGSMPNCLGENCKKSCCVEKNISNWGKPRAPYFTSLANRGEYEYQLTLSPSLEELGVEVTRADTTQDRGVRISYLVNKCINSDGSCKMERRKPLICRIFPFHLTSRMPIGTSCERAREIAFDTEVVSSILEVRRLLGFKDEEVWLRNLFRNF